MKYDIIGDVHGHAYELVVLLKKMGYTLSSNGHYYHRGRMAIFVGDYIDRGPQSRDVCRIVRGMVESESAIALMGNHEYNAICYHTKNKDGDLFLRPRNKRNTKNHQQTLDAFAEKRLTKVCSSAI